MAAHTLQQTEEGFFFFFLSADLRKGNRASAESIKEVKLEFPDLQLSGSSPESGETSCSQEMQSEPRKSGVKCQTSGQPGHKPVRGARTQLHRRSENTSGRK